MKLTESHLRKLIREELQGEEIPNLKDEAWEIIYDPMNIHVIPEKVDEKRLEFAHTYILRRLQKLTDSK